MDVIAQNMKALINSELHTYNSEHVAITQTYRQHIAC